MRTAVDVRKRSPRPKRYGPVGLLVGTALGLSLLALVAVGAPKNTAPATMVAFLIAAPAVPVFLALRALDLLARTILAAATALVVNAVVAEVMLLTGTWSLTGGVMVVALIGIALAVVGYLSPPAAPPPSPLDTERA